MSCFFVVGRLKNRAIALRRMLIGVVGVRSLLTLHIDSFYDLKTSEKPTINAMFVIAVYFLLFAFSFLKLIILLIN